MPRDILPFRTVITRPDCERLSSPDVAVTAVPLLRRLCETLARAVPFQRASQERESRWGVPALEFFDVNAQATWDRERPAAVAFADSPIAIRAARKHPQAAAAWTLLGDLCDDVFTLAARYAEVRHAARAIPQLRERLAAVGTDHPRCRGLADLLHVCDDDVITVIAPDSLSGLRVRLLGIADLFQFHMLFADIAGKDHPGSRPDGRIVDAYRGEPTDPEADIATARFQFYAPAALRSDDTLPAKFAGSEHWYWGHESPRAVPVVAGEKLLLAGPPPYSRQWPVGRRFPAVTGSVEVLHVLSSAEVCEWLHRLTGHTPVTAPVRRAA